MVEVSIKLWRAEPAARNEIGLRLISISLKRRRWGKMKRMSKTTGNKVNIDKNSSFSRFALCGKTISVSGQTTDINTPIRQKEESFWFIGYLVTGLEIISVQIHFSSVTYCFCTFVILFFFHSNYPFFCVALETLLFITTVWKFCKPWLNLLTIYIYVFCAGASLKQAKRNTEASTNINEEGQF